MKINNSQLAGSLLIGFGSAMLVLTLFEIFDHRVEKAYPYSTYMAMLTSGIFVLSGVSYFMPGLSTSIATRLIVLRAIITGKEPPDVERLRKGLLVVFQSRSEVNAEAMRHTEVPGLTAPPPLPDEWNSLVRPVLHQASQYMAPTYYLNGHLQVIDWNLGFDLIFEDIIGELRGRHVNWFIARLKNSAEVFTHARGFPDKVERQPQVDTERIVYNSARFGLIEFEKIATKLHDLQGQQRGWAVTLMVRSIDSWEKLVGDLAAVIESDKFWSIYSVSYDRVLNNYPGYDQLLRTVVRSVPDEARRVVDLGAGTGNLSRLLLEGNRRVWAVEKNMAMLDMFRTKDFVAAAGDRLRIVKSSVEHLDMLASEDPFDAAVAVNVLYAVDDVPACLRSLNRILRLGATFAFSTTYDGTNLTPLLADIQSTLSRSTYWKELSPHYARVHSLNMKLQNVGLTTRYSRDEYRTWLEQAGFRVELCEVGHYVGAVIVVRATKVQELVPSSADSVPVTVTHVPVVSPAMTTAS